MPSNNIGDRMKENYENRARFYLTRRTPVILRLDGRAFHSFTRGFERPYDKVFHETMKETAFYLCKNIQGAKVAYTQSDEISILLTDYDTLQTDAWFDYNIQKMCSVAASMATLAFSRYFEKNVAWFNIRNKLNGVNDADTAEWNTYIKYLQAIEKGATFDCRCFNIPEAEVVNYFIWRQQDATNNAIQMLGQANFSHKELQSKRCNDIQDMLMTQKGINFNDMPVEFKRGICCYRNANNEWIIDTDIPIFTQNRSFIECWATPESESKE